MYASCAKKKCTVCVRQVYIMMCTFSFDQISSYIVTSEVGTWRAFFGAKSLPGSAMTSVVFDQILGCDQFASQEKKNSAGAEGNPLARNVLRWREIHSDGVKGTSQLFSRASCSVFWCLFPFEKYTHIRNSKRKTLHAWEIQNEGICMQINEGICMQINEGICMQINEGICMQINEGICKLNERQHQLRIRGWRGACVRHHKLRHST